MSQILLFSQNQNDTKSPSKSNDVEEQARPGENSVLSFELKNIDYEHPSLDRLGLPEHVLRAYEVGFYSGKGLLKDSIVMPVRRAGGDLIAYLAIGSEREAIYPPADKFDPQGDLFGTNFPIDLHASNQIYLVSSPVDVLVCAAFGVAAIATMCAFPSERHCEQLRELSGQFATFRYLFRHDQNCAELGTTCRILADKSTHFWGYQLLEKQFSSS